MTPQDVLDYWFSLDRKAWFARDRDVDERIRARFLDLYERARHGDLAGWAEKPRSCLALVIVLDQFPRNMFRGEARAFGTDAAARQAARVLVDQGWDRELAPLERMFAYLPFEHSESLADQERCLALMKPLADYPETADLPEWAEAHLAVIRRFGRFPHRNAALGRASTPDEEAFLAQPGSRF
jgi:uncharacterized protein (DUF924 family)